MINENYGETEKAFSKLPSLKMYDSCLHSCEVLFLCCDQETLDALAEMYSLLNEEDMWAGLWQQRCRYPETATAIAYETQGFYEQAQSAYEVVHEIVYSQPSS